VCEHKHTHDTRTMICTSFTLSHVYMRSFSHSFSHTLKGGPEPLEKEINVIVGSKREDRFSQPFFELVQKSCRVRFSYLFRHGNLCKVPRTLRKFLQECQKIAGCYECAVYGSRPLIASKPGSSILERPSLENITSQPWSDASYSCTTASSTLLVFQTKRD